MKNISIKLLSDKAQMPRKANKTDAGFDLFISEVKNKGLFKVHYKLGIAVDFPANMYAEVYSRSSIHKRFLWLCNSVGIIDNGYRGEWHAVFYRIPFVSRNYKVGDACCQAIFKEMQEVATSQVYKLTDSDRGVNGFGSSGNGGEL